MVRNVAGPSSMSRPPAFQFYPKQWLGDDRVLSMDWDARGMHMHFMCIAWQQEPPCTIPADETVLRKWCGNPKRWRKVKNQILAAWKLIDGRYVQDGLLRVYEKSAKYSESRQQAARSRWHGKEKDPSIRSAYAMHTDMHMQCSSSSSSMKNKEKIAVSTSSSPASSIKRILKVPDEAFIARLKQNAAYRDLDIDREIGKLQAWLLTPKGKGKHLTQQRLVNWLNRVDTSMTVPSQTVSRRPRQVVI